MSGLIAIPSAAKVCRRVCVHCECIAARQLAEKRCSYCRQRFGFGARITLEEDAHLTCGNWAAQRAKHRDPARSSKAAQSEIPGDTPSTPRSDAQSDVVLPPGTDSHRATIQTSGYMSGLEELRLNQFLRRAHRISEYDLKMLAGVALMGRVHSANDLLFILETIRGVGSRAQ
jgi:hypothetical protein